jgi:uncharacterized protein (TIGR02145 family)
MDGGTYSFYVRSNHAFTVTVPTGGDPKNIITFQSFTENSPNTGAGTPVSFTLIDDMTNKSILEADVTLIINPVTPGDFLPKKVIVTGCSNVQPESNSYLLASGDIGILIPVVRCNHSDLGTSRLGSTEAFTSQLVWTDNDKRVSANSAVRAYCALGTGSGGYVYVKPGTGTGNAVIAIKNTADQILWSWHAWVCSPSDMPAVTSPNGFVDRNLGATTKTPGLVSTLGLHYQWGRKDPFPASASVSSDVERTLYTETGTTRIELKIAGNGDATTGNLDIAVANPLTYYCGTNYDHPDWYSYSTQIINNYLWRVDQKTVYDPCPQGWRVVPSHDNFDLTFENFQWNADTKGRTSATCGGFYPAAGFRSSYATQANAAGTLRVTGTHIYMWISNKKNDTTSQSIVVSNTDGESDPIKRQNTRANGYPVRCIEE